MIEVAAFMMMVGFFDSVMIGATARALGVKPKPAMKSTLSFTISSWAEPLGDCGNGTGTVLDHEFDLLARDRVAMLFHVCLGAVGHVHARYRRTCRSSEPIMPIFMVSPAA